MAANPLPSNLDPLLSYSEDVADGMAAHGAVIGILQNTEPRIRTDITGLRTAKLIHETSKATKVTAVATQTVKDSNGKAVIAAASNVLAVRYGATWSTAWEPTGFPNNSIGVPRRIDERLNLLASLRDYFTANPTHENAPLGVTAAAFATLFTELSDARSAVNAAIADAAAKLALRDAAESTLRRRLRGTIEELTQLLDPLDSRWYAFGLLPPGAEDTPDQVTGVILTAGPAGSGIVHGDWPDAARATSYRVYIQVVGVDPDFRLYDTVSDSDVTISSLPPGATVRVRVVAVNAEGNEAPPSDVVEIVVPATP